MNMVEPINPNVSNLVPNNPTLKTSGYGGISAIVTSLPVKYGFLDKLPQLLERQKGVTGFVSVLGADPRKEVFARYNHLDRVSCIAEYLASMLNDPKVDLDKVRFLAVTHDINRLPFAHNCEGALGFDQAKNIRGYLMKNLPGISEDWISGAEDVLREDPSRSMEAAIVITADKVDGYIEDPVLAITALGVPSKFLPQEVRNLFGFDGEFEGKLVKLEDLFDKGKTEDYDLLLKSVCREYATKFLEARKKEGEILFVKDPEYENKYKKPLRKGFMEQRVFPINNVVVSHGPIIGKIMKQLIERGITIDHLLSSTDAETSYLAGKMVIKDVEYLLPWLKYDVGKVMTKIDEIAGRGENPLNVFMGFGPEQLDSFKLQGPNQP